MHAKHLRRRVADVAVRIIVGYLREGGGRPSRSLDLGKLDLHLRPRASRLRLWFSQYKFIELRLLQYSVFFWVFKLLWILILHNREAWVTIRRNRQPGLSPHLPVIHRALQLHTHGRKRSSNTPLEACLLPGHLHTSRVILTLRLLLHLNTILQTRKWAMNSRSKDGRTKRTKLGNDRRTSQSQSVCLALVKGVKKVRILNLSPPVRLIETRTGCRPQTSTSRLDCLCRLKKSCIPLALRFLMPPMHLRHYTRMMSRGRYRGRLHLLAVLRLTMTNTKTKYNPTQSRYLRKLSPQQYDGSKAVTRSTLRGPSHLGAESSA